MQDLVSTTSLPLDPPVYSGSAYKLTDHVALLLRFAAAGIFLIAAVSKTFSIPSFIFTLTRLGWFPANLLSFVAFLVIVAELTTGLLLLSSKASWQRWGALAGMGMALAFIGVHIAFLSHGVAQVCSCLGLLLQQPSPGLMLAVNLVLFGVCALTFGLTLSQKIPSNQQPSPRSQFAKGVLCYGILMACSLQAAHSREEARASEKKSVSAKLHYGETAPRFALRSSAGKVVSPQDLSGKWTLLSFVKPGCDPCHKDLGDLSRWYPAQKGKLNALAVVVGSALFTSPQQTARRFAQETNIPIPVVCDGDQIVSKRYMGEQTATPFHVLLDAKGQVRMVQSGREEIDSSKKSGLMENLDNILNRVPLSRDSRAYQSGGAVGQSVPDGVINLQGKEVKLSSLWRHGPLVLTFSVQNCHGCDERSTIIERTLGQSSKVQVLNLYGSVPEAQNALSQSHGSTASKTLVGADRRGTLARAYNVQFAPSTFLIANGRAWHAAEAQSSSFNLERALAQISTFSVPKNTVPLGLQRHTTKESQ